MYKLKLYVKIKYKIRKVNIMQYEDDYALALEKELINLEKQSRKEEDKMLKKLVREFERIENDRILTLSVDEYRL